MMFDIQVLEEDKNKKLVALSQGLPEMAQRLLDKKINTAEEYAYFCDILKKIKKREKDIETFRTMIVKPLNELVKQWNSEFKPAKDGVEKIKRLLNSMLVAYDDEQERLRIAEQKRLEDERRKAEEEARKAAEEALRAEEDGKEEQSDEAVEKMEEAHKTIEEKETAIKEVSAPVKPVTTEFSKTSFRVDTKFEIIQEELVPHTLCSPDKTKIDNAIKAGIKEIPGVRIYTVKTPITR